MFQFHVWLHVQFCVEHATQDKSQTLQHACSNRRDKVKLYYAVEGAFYTASVFMLLFWEERRKDFNAMLLHHVATSSLIAVSYFFS